MRGKTLVLVNRMKSYWLRSNVQSNRDRPSLAIDKEEHVTAWRNRVMLWIGVKRCHVHQLAARRMPNPPLRSGGRLCREKSKNPLAVR